MSLFPILIPQSLNSQFLNLAIWQLCSKTSIFYEGFGSSILSLSLTLNPAFSGKPCRRSRLKRSGSGKPVNAYSIYTFPKKWNSFPHKLALFYTPVRQISLTFCSKDGMFLHYFVFANCHFQTIDGIFPRRGI